MIIPSETLIFFHCGCLIKKYKIFTLIVIVQGWVKTLRITNWIVLSPNKQMINRSIFPISRKNLQIAKIQSSAKDSQICILTEKYTLESGGEITAKIYVTQTVK